MKKVTLFTWVFLMVFSATAQDSEDNTYWQVKVDFLEPLINPSAVARLDYGFNRHLLGKANRGFCIGGDVDFSSHIIESKITDESAPGALVYGFSTADRPWTGGGTGSPGVMKKCPGKPYIFAA
ncbi:MAG: hypothetical protein SF053_00485 [Bacteroidia bacterium]|nr:hypothetical protein [Bacteroidia bacterium]